MNKTSLHTKWCDHNGSDLWSQSLSWNCCYSWQNLVYFTQSRKLSLRVYLETTCILLC